jgi:TRAP-type mannitol/chloroaromatic compound transport system permease small subunit
LAVAPVPRRREAIARESFPYNSPSIAGERRPWARRSCCNTTTRTARHEGESVNALLAISRAIDAISERVGRLVYWLVLAVVLISAANASVRKLFNYSSNAYLEIQWYLFSVIFLFGAGYTLLRNEHVRIDIIQGRLSPRAQNIIDVLGIVLFLMPMSVIILWLSWPLFIDSLQRHEVSTNAGGLIIWPARLMIPVGFGLLILQAISELIKRIAYLMGRIRDPLEKRHEMSAEEELAKEIAAQRGVESPALGAGRER